MTRRKSLARPRSIAYSRQAGCCFYCGLPMWQTSPDEFAMRHGITLGQAKALRCTGEHLEPHAEGGSSSQANIVAACWWCNSIRHRSQRVLAPDLYKKRVRRRVAAGRWHDPGVLQAVADGVERSCICRDDGFA